MGDEGGFARDLPNSQEAIEVILTAIENGDGDAGPVTITDFDPAEDTLAITIQTARFDTGGETAEADDTKEETEAFIDEVSFTQKQALRTPAFWIIV